MQYKIVADMIVVIHFMWILFMISGFVLTIYGFLRWDAFFDKWLFRTLHLCGIVFVVVLVILRKYCPLTVWENMLRAEYDPHSVYPGSFVLYYIEKLVYPDINPLIIVSVTIFIGLFTVVVFIIRPPHKFKKWIKTVLR